MTGAADRRRALQALALGLAVPLVARRAQAAGPGLYPPGNDMLYRRSLTRFLPDGQAITVTRSFAIRFMPTPSGFRINGEQRACEVEAPPALAALARLEESRVETGLFPLELDQAGQIRAVSLSGAAQQASWQEARLHQSRLLIDSQPGAPSGERAAALRFVASLAQAGEQLISALPAYLFAPPARPLRDEQTIALPDGQTGRVLIEFSAERDPATGLMRQARRQVETRLASTVRTMREEWALTTL